VDGETILQILVLAGYVVFRIISDRVKKKREPVEVPPDDDGVSDDDFFPEEEEVAAEAETGGVGWPEPEPVAEPAEVVDIFAEERARFGAKLDAFIGDAERLYSLAHLEIATRRVAEVLSDYVVPSATELRNDVRVATGQINAEQMQMASSLELVSAAVETFIEQRRNAYLGPRIVDSDAMAQACYKPVLEFASMNRLPLTSATPVTVLSPFDLGIWTGFIPTGVAPIFLPPEFFDRLVWWPALAHEVGHDFLAATSNADDRVRSQLGISAEALGVVPLNMTEEGISVHEIHRVFGAWFEEIFCDVFGTLMAGPAYGYSMLELFASPHDPRRVATVALDPRGRMPRYDTHPPRHLRVLLCAHVLELAGEHESAASIRDEWTAIHGEIEGIVYPVAGGAIGIPIEPIVERMTEIADSLYREGLEGFDGRSLSAIPGVDWGPHMASASRRAMGEMLSGRAPTSEPPRAVIAGAVLAWREQPDLEGQLIELARRAIVGVTETREDAYDSGGFEDQAAGDELRGLEANELRDAFVVHTLLAPPPALRSARRAGGGLIARGRWHRPSA